MNSNTKREEKENQKDADDKALGKLEEMWDRKILKGDDEFMESRLSSSSVTKDKTKHKEEESKPKRRRRRGII